MLVVAFIFLYIMTPSKPGSNATCRPVLVEKPLNPKPYTLNPKVEQECCERCGKSYITTLEVTYEIEKVGVQLQGFRRLKFRVEV